MNTIYSILKKVIKTPASLIKRSNAKKSLAQITAHKNSSLRAVGIAIQETLDQDLLPEEQKIISMIEERRSHLLTITKEIPVIDYGAGSSNSSRSWEEMKRGVKSTAVVSKVTKASKPKFWATMLFKIIRKLEPVSCIELGTCVGISASYQAAALNINGRGKLITLEGSPEIANIAKATLTNLQIKNTNIITGPFHETLEDVFVSSKPIDYFFNDGHHDHSAVIKYFDQAFSYLSEKSIVIFDDISWSPGMRKAWSDIENDERISATIDLQTMGIAIIDKTLPAKEKFRIPL